ncbi:cache domain-containing sensor histidine kinase [Paenibacillus sp. IHBB 3054]|uniref:cache domain-containing sensor histidine kinase n=1 Tax=Paenibacillus sp. IHBB 3054 TaxID=3425689 RepID=UPI003F674D96
MKLHTLRSKLTLSYALIIAIPVAIIMVCMPAYYQYLLERETEALTRNTLTSMTEHIVTYLEQLEQITYLPYFSPELMQALITKNTSDYSSNTDFVKYPVELTLNTFLPAFLLTYGNNLSAALLLTQNGDVYSQTNGLSDVVEDYPFFEQPWYLQTVQADGKATFISTHHQDYFTAPLTKRVFSVARVIKDPESLRPLAVIMADAQTSLLDEIVIKDFGVRSISAILNEKGEVFYSTAPLSEHIIKEISSAGVSQVKDSGESYVVISKPIRQANWKMVALLSKSELREKVEWMYIVGLLFAFIGLLLTLLLLRYVSRWIVGPFLQMKQAMKQVERGNFQVRLEPVGKDEIASLGYSFNHMIDTINELIQKEYVAVLNEKEMRFRALQAQIEPHFLFNTLNGFFALNRIGEKKKLEEAILSLSSLLRYTLVQENWTTIGETFTFLRKYCVLQQLRFDERLEFSLQFDPRISEFKIPKLLLQPLVENAIIHGIEPSALPCRLVVDAGLEQEGEDCLYIKIEDSGVGFLEPAAELEDSIGLRNVQERLKFAYPSAAFDIHSSPGMGTTVTIRIPLKDVEK